MTSTTIRVLVLDDEESVRSNLRAFFEDEGFEVLLCASGEEALDLLSRFQVDVAVVDVRLPAMNGHDFILRAHEIQPGLKFLVYTGSPDYDLPAALVESGIVPREGFIHKPIHDMKILARAILDLAGQRGRR